MLYTAHLAGADVLVTADVKHHIAQLALDIEIGIIDAGHFETEIIFCDFMKKFLTEKFNDIDVFTTKCPSQWDVV
jgi:putative NIF3 family GTP cyclohydrolase 1 type 2